MRQSLCDPPGPTIRFKSWTSTHYFSNSTGSSATLPGKFLGIVGQDPSDSESNRWHMCDIFRLCFHSFEVYSIDSSKASLCTLQTLLSYLMYFWSRLDDKKLNNSIMPWLLISIYEFDCCTLNMIGLNSLQPYESWVRAALHTRGWANSPWGRLHEISAFFGLEAGLNYTLW